MQIIENIKEAAEDAKSNNQDYGVIVTFAEVLTIIQEQLSETERKEYKLDFDIDKRYM